MFTLPDLPYPYEALEPYIDKATMILHHDKHHAAYVDNLNKALEKYPDLLKKDIDELLTGEIPEEIKQAVINHGGGHFNHSFFWQIMGSQKTEPEGELLRVLESTFGGFEKFKEAFSQKAMGVFGSGWAWLVLTPKGDLVIKKHSFQNPPLAGGNQPLLGLDVWEHAYYLKYQNRRAEYIENWWEVVNWREVEKRFQNLQK